VYVRHPSSVAGIRRPPVPCAAQVWMISCSEGHVQGQTVTRRLRSTGSGCEGRAPAAAFHVKHPVDTLGRNGRERSPSPSRRRGGSLDTLGERSPLFGCRVSLESAPRQARGTSGRSPSPSRRTARRPSTSSGNGRARPPSPSRRTAWPAPRQARGTRDGRQACRGAREDAPRRARGANALPRRVHRTVPRQARGTDGHGRRARRGERHGPPLDKLGERGTVAKPVEARGRTPLDELGERAPCLGAVTEQPLDKLGERGEGGVAEPVAAPPRRRTAPIPGTTGQRTVAPPTRAGRAR